MHLLVWCSHFANSSKHHDSNSSLARIFEVMAVRLWYCGGLHCTTRIRSKCIPYLIIYKGSKKAAQLQIKKASFPKYGRDLSLGLSWSAFALCTSLSVRTTTIKSDELVPLEFGMVAKSYCVRRGARNCKRKWGVSGYCQISSLQLLFKCGRSGWINFFIDSYGISQ